MQNNNPIVNGKRDNKRIWSLYNESLVRRMKDILDLRDIRNYRHDLGKQNRKKNGRPYIIPDKIIEILARIRAVFNASFRSLESYMRIFQEILGIPGISYSSIFRRIRKIKVPEIMNPSSSVAVDSTGFKTTIRGDWLSNKWAKKRKGWIKLHVSADTERIMASRISITMEHSHDATQFTRLITGSEQRVFADKAYDSRKIFNILRNNGSEAIIPLRKNFSTLSRTSPLRGKTAREIRKLGEDQ
ncbi:Transposase DDE domain protein [Thermoplasmatales archaeon]|nr:Transposase DDE domain protein [Thermoplasmatales archaeon]